MTYEWVDVQQSRHGMPASWYVDLTVNGEVKITVWDDSRVKALARARELALLLNEKEAP